VEENMSKFIWYDLMTPDVAKSKDFYAHVVGWKIEDSGMPGMNYNILNAGEIMVGGMMQTPPEMMEGAKGRPWMGHVYVASADAAAEKAKTLGGKIYQPAADIPGVGRFAVLGDTSGAGFIAFRPNGSGQPKKVADGTPGHIGWRELMSADWKKDWDFYSALFGWQTKEAMDMGPMGTYQIFETADGQQGGMMTKAADDVSPPHWNYYFNVDSISAAMKRALSKGASFHGEPIEVPGGGWAVNGTDPVGAAFSLYSLNK
jgi:predicted enzyme related to lactoylglutathione lyase